MIHIIQNLNGIYRLTDECNSHLHRILKRRIVKKKEILIRAGEYITEICFVDTGLFRAFDLNQEGEEVTIGFMKEGDVIFGVLTSNQKKRSLHNVYAIEDSVIYTITPEELDELYNKYVEFNAVGRILLAEYTELQEMRAYVANTMDNLGIYKWFIETFGNLVLRVTVKDLSSYLGMPDTSLSRVRSMM